MKICIMAALLMCWAVQVTTAAQQYLPRAGPNPFRFQPAAPVSLPPDTFLAYTSVPKPKASEPAVALPTAPPVASPEKSLLGPAPGSAATATAGSPAQPGAGTETSSSPAPVTPVTGLPGSSAQTLTPQMLLQYFQNTGVGGTNETAIALPVLFTPPLPPQSEPSSKASYQIIPGPVAGPGSPGQSTP